MAEAVLIVEVLTLLWSAKVGEVVLFLFVHFVCSLLVGGEVALPVGCYLSISLSSSISCSHFLISWFIAWYRLSEKSRCIMCIRLALIDHLLLLITALIACALFISFVPYHRGDIDIIDYTFSEHKYIVKNILRKSKNSVKSGHRLAIGY
jgi:hypothetical protein